MSADLTTTNPTITVPSIHSNDRDERIAARRLRIKSRNEQRKLESEGLKESNAKGPDSIERARMRAKESLDIIKKLVEEGNEQIEDIRTETLEAEQKHRIDQQKKKEERAAKRTNAKEHSDNANGQILAIWEKEKDSKKNHEELLAVLKELKSMCDDVINFKEKISKDFQQEAKVKEDEYFKSLTKQADDIDKLLKVSRTQFKNLLDTCDKELDTIEATFNTEKDNLRKSQNLEIEALYEDRRNKEVKYMEMKQRRGEESRQEIDELRVLDSEEYTELKIRLESEIQTREQYLQELKAVYQLNEEKLTYNQQILQDRNFEHQQLIQQQKKKINRLQDSLSTLKAKYTKLDKGYREKNMELTDEYKRITEQYKDLQTKFKHFQERDQKKYLQIWSMNEERVKELVKKLLQSDKVISEQQLGFNWFPPQEDLFQYSLDNSHDKQLKTLPKQNETSSVIYSEPIKKVIDLISDGFGFLVEDQVRKIADKEGKNMVRIESILSALGIQTKEDADKLLKYFVTNSNSPDPDLVSPNDVVAALKSFVQDHQATVKEANLQAITATEEQKKEKLYKKREKVYWEKLTQIISEEKRQVWMNLERELIKYNKTLNDRNNLLEETDQIRAQNAELKALLNQYLSAKVNQDLLIPPIIINST